MAQAKQGDTVKIHYTGKLEDGTVFDTSTGRDPLQFNIGENQVIQGFEKGVTGMALNESKTVTIPPDEAYGPHREEMVLNIPRDQFPPNIEPEIGQQLELGQENGQTTIAIVSQLTESNVTLDANHPLAGETLIFDIQL
ncbi:MAG: peptidylprolyl isomerase, partial [Thermodesulfobacteriota bacterium]|nr:peptidylprolyl isomerase [Thermodesulfobacteriota bacterium]